MNGAERKLADAIAELANDRPFVVAISGLPGSGKTTLAGKLTQQFAQRAIQVSEDDFCLASTPERKKFLQQALETNDMQRLQYLAAPTNAADNPFANPLSWYDWSAISQCLKTLKSGRLFIRHNGWDQQTGLCNREIRYTPIPNQPLLCFIDSNYPLEYRDLIDAIVVIDVSPELAAQRQASRDAHRSDKTYLAYKNIIDEFYCQPYLQRVRSQAYFLLQPQGQE